MDKCLDVQPPFHLEATVRVLQRRPSNLVDVWADDCYRRLLRTHSGVLMLVEVSNDGTVDAPDLRLRVLHGARSASAATAAASTVRRILGLDVDARPLQQLIAGEPRMRDVAAALRGMRPPRFAGLFEAFANVVPFQQVSLDAGVAVVGRIVERFGEAIEYEGRRAYAFPDVRAVAAGGPALLRDCGLSQKKAEALHSAARAIAAGEVTEEQLSAIPSRDAVRFLTELPGIGPWSASLILLRGMGRLDVFPPGDVGAARGLASLLGLPTNRTTNTAIERFGARRGYLYFCSLGNALLTRGLIRPAPGARAHRRS